MIKVRPLGKGCGCCDKQKTTVEREEHPMECEVRWIGCPSSDDIDRGDRRARTAGDDVGSADPSGSDMATENSSRRARGQALLERLA